MFKRIIVLATLLCALPALANAFTLTTWAKSQGGVINSPVMMGQTVTNGSMSATFTNTSTVTAIPNSGWTISRVQVNGITQTNPASGASFSKRFVYPLTGNASLYATFARIQYTITMTGSGSSGSATPSSVKAYAGVQNPPVTFLFVPAKGKTLTGVTGLVAGDEGANWQYVDAVTGNPILASQLAAASNVGKRIKLNIVNVSGFMTLAATFGSSSLTAGADQAVMCGTKVTLKGTTGALSYKWTQVQGPHVVLSNALTYNPTFTAPATPCTLRFKLVAGGNTTYTYVYVTNSYAALGRTQCQTCHDTQGVGPTVFAAWSTSVHKQGGRMCWYCHSQANNGGHPGNDPACANCHTTTPTANHSVYTAEIGGDASDSATCAACHCSTPDIHSVTARPPSAGGCVACHSFALNAGPQFVQDNNGVRQITGAGGEFQQWSHHIINDTGNAVDPVDAQCVVCHLEGTVIAGAVVVDSTVHMKTRMVYLRDCNTALNQSKSDGTGFTWDPQNPNHTAMDQFCMSCHNASGAATAFNNLSTGGIKRIATPAGKAFSALNPFGDKIQNNYDGLSRGAVVAVYDQFNPSNTSHHAVRQPRYTLSTAGTPGSLDAKFANISANNAAAGYTNLRFASGQSYVGTLSDTGKFVTTYKPLVNSNGAFAPLADNSQLHCGDCHTNGQWAARGTLAFGLYSAAYGPGVSKYYKQAIGAHGSDNEYMLRNSNGDNSLNPMNLVCYICHSATIYGSGSASTVTRMKFNISGVTATGLPATNPGSLNGNSWTLYNYTTNTTGGNYTNGRPLGPYGVGLLDDPSQQKRNATGTITTNATAHDGVAGTLGNYHCNDDQNNTAGITGLARLNAKALTTAQFYGYTSGHYPSGTGGGNAFGIKCANCHNSGDGTYPGYGGIHGNAFRVGNTATVMTNAAYTTYSATSAGTGTPTTWATASRKPYRFLPGLGNFRYNGGSDWTLFMNASGRVGCYTLNGAGADAGPTKSALGGTGRYTGSKMIADDNGLLGTWGTCTEHTNNNHPPSRNVLRPTQY